MLSFFSDEGLDLSQHTLTDTMFVGPDLDQDGEEVITGRIQERNMSCVMGEHALRSLSLHQQYNTKQFH